MLTRKTKNSPPARNLEGVPKKGVLRGSGGVKRDAEKGMPKKGSRKKGSRKKGCRKRDAEKKK